jgi:sec-independent protein translocase protein TatA
MGTFSLTHWLVVLAIILILFGAGKLPRVMGDFAKGIRNFKAGMKEDDGAASTPARAEDAGEQTDRKPSTPHLIRHALRSRSTKAYLPGRVPLQIAEG